MKFRILSLFCMSIFSAYGDTNVFASFKDLQGAMDNALHPELAELIETQTQEAQAVTRVKRCLSLARQQMQASENSPALAKIHQFIRKALGENPTEETKIRQAIAQTISEDYATQVEARATAEAVKQALAQKSRATQKKQDEKLSIKAYLSKNTEVLEKFQNFLHTLLNNKNSEAIERAIAQTLTLRTITQSAQENPIVQNEFAKILQELLNQEEDMMALQIIQQSALASSKIRQFWQEQIEKLGFIAILVSQAILVIAETFELHVEP